MTGLTLSVSTTVALPAKVAASSLLAPGTVAEGATGVPSLAAFVDLMIGKTTVAPNDGQAGGERQDDAATGNSLPQKDDDKSDPALAWLLSVAPIALPAAPAKLVATGAVTAPLTPTAGTPQPALPSLPLALASDAPQAKPGAEPAPQQILPETQSQPATTPISVALRSNTAAPTTVDPALTAAADAQSKTLAANQQALAADRSLGSQAVVQPIRITMPQAAPVTLASLASANAPMPALFALAMAPERKPGDGEGSQPGDPTAAATLLTPVDAVQLVAKPGQAERQALDMGRQDWPQKMIDRIEALRDDANANDTSIRLKPDALGRIDVSLRTHADGAVTVRFAAEQPTTRALLADAAPQLNAAAEARGIRLTGTSVDLSGSGMAGGDRPRPQAEVRQDSKNRLATGADDDIRAVDDGRVA
ncbi:flagellar hook-length control protein FliK [Sphingomonas asaccharolytica]|uniref:flagellar hook-length control protein FliK n=1 Tax=Sphingomonas asaccharolytica TaxID=40681 RepID=UPI00083392F3|nr:flagellar hook-length control protein FliK [Sphingomonas asaccharolytica]